jgi:ECF sigma factor
VDDALMLFEQVDPRKARVVELRFFVRARCPATHGSAHLGNLGLSVDETAEVLAVSPQTAMRDWKLAKAWLMRELEKGA